jgi:Flp pilus assembly protein TadG
MMKRPAQEQTNKSNAAQSMVETALLLPIMILLMVGILDLGRLYFAYITIFNAAREGARYGVSNPTITNQIKAHTKQEVDGAIVTLDDSDIAITCDGPSGPYGPCIAGNAIVVTVTYTKFQLITSTIFGGGNITMRATAQMEIY